MRFDLNDQILSFAQSFASIVLSCLKFYPKPSPKIFCAFIGKHQSLACMALTKDCFDKDTAKKTMPKKYNQKETTLNLKKDYVNQTFSQKVAI